SASELRRDAHRSRRYGRGATAAAAHRCDGRHKSVHESEGPVTFWALQTATRRANHARESRRFVNYAALKLLNDNQMHCWVRRGLRVALEPARSRYTVPRGHRALNTPLRSICNEER